MKPSDALRLITATFTYQIYRPDRDGNPIVTRKTGHAEATVLTDQQPWEFLLNPVIPGYEIQSIKLIHCVVEIPPDQLTAEQIEKLSTLGCHNIKW